MLNNNVIRIEKPSKRLIEFMDGLKTLKEEQRKRLKQTKKFDAKIII